jgi:hypothetical protein
MTKVTVLISELVFLVELSTLVNADGLKWEYTFTGSRMMLSCFERRR